MITLNVNIDHIATIRNARGGTEPEPVTAALMAELAGAMGIVCHLREDRRHINDRDLMLLKQLVTTKLDLEMAASPEIIEIAIKTQPDLVTIVPEKREELTTEGGLDVASDMERFTTLSDRMHEKDIEVSFFIEPDEKQIAAVKECGGDMVEFHTGTYANLREKHLIATELYRLNKAVNKANDWGLMVAAGHGLNYTNTQAICEIQGINELSIGHSIISRAAFVGIDQAVREMLDIIHTHSY